MYIYIYIERERERETLSMYVYIYIERERDQSGMCVCEWVRESSGEGGRETERAIKGDWVTTLGREKDRQRERARERDLIQASIKGREVIAKVHVGTFHVTSFSPRQHALFHVSCQERNTSVSFSGIHHTHTLSLTHNTCKCANTYNSYIYAHMHTYFMNTHTRWYLSQRQQS